MMYSIWGLGGEGIFGLNKERGRGGRVGGSVKSWAKRI